MIDDARLHPLPSRRTLLTVAGLGGAGLLGTGLLAGCGRASGRSLGAATSSPNAASTSTVRTSRHAYGPDDSQFGDLYEPTGASRGTVVVIHGGFWLAGYSADLGAPLAADLAGRGWTAWNLEYRRVGNGGGWPHTLDDVAAGIDLLATLGVGTSTVVALGHSAGGQLAAWAAGRAELPPTAPGHGPRVAITGVVAQAGVLDLARAAREGVGGTAVPGLLGGSPGQQPARYAQASPQQQIPLSVPVHCVHGDSDGNVPISQSLGYVEAAVRAGAPATMHRVRGDHFTLIDVTSPAWRTIIEVIAALS